MGGKASPERSGGMSASEQRSDVLRALKRDVRKMRRLALMAILTNVLFFAVLLILRDASEFFFR